MAQLKIASILHLVWLLVALNPEAIAEVDDNTTSLPISLPVIAVTEQQGSDAVTAQQTNPPAGFKVCGTSAVSKTIEKESTNTNSAFWSVLSGEQYREIVDGGRCVTDGGDKYGNNERCRVEALRPFRSKRHSMHLNADMTM